MVEQIKKRWAAVYANDDFTCFQTYSGLRRTARDPIGELIFLTSKSDSKDFGRAIFASLSKSRMLAPEEIGTFFDLLATERNYAAWITEASQKYDYRSRRAIFEGMKLCLIDQFNGTISIKPTHQEKLDAWSSKGIEKTDHVLIPEGSTDYEVGNALLLALTRCNKN